MVTYCHPGLDLIRGTGRAHTVLSFKQTVTHDRLTHSLHTFTIFIYQSIR